jgi:hypothetical protein
MKNLVREISAIDPVIRELEKNNSKLENGHFIQAHNSNDSLISRVRAMRMDIISLDKKTKNSIEDIGFLDTFIRELEKINSKIENGNIIFAWRDNRRVLAQLQSTKESLLKSSQEE